MLALKQIKQFYPEGENISERNMLREYLQYKILKIIFSSSIANKLSFIGGTAIRIIYGSDRFSEDLDFDHFGLSAGEFKSLAEIIKKGLEKEGLKIKTRFILRETYRCYLRFEGLLFEYGLSGHREEKILIQLDTTRQNFDTSPELKIINKFGIFADVRVNPIDIILAQKIAAALERKRVLGRDLYDIIYLAPLSEPHAGYLAKKLNIQSATTLKTKLTQRLSRYKLDQLAQDILPFVSNEEQLEVIRKFGRWLGDWKISL